MNIPQPVSLETAIRIYYEKFELRKKDVDELFGVMSKTQAYLMFNKAREVMAKHNITTIDSRAVNTECAYEAWGFNIEDLENRYNKLRRIFKR